MKCFQPTRVSLRTTFLFSFLILGPAVGALFAAPVADPTDAPSVWETLPRNTFLAARIPDAQACFDALKTNTKFGAAMLSEDRLARLGALLEEGPWEELHAAMQEYDLEPNDLLALVAGETGFAMVAREELGPPDMLAWIETGQELAERVVEAIGTAVERHQDDEHPIRRVDFDLDGRTVIHLGLPRIHYVPDYDVDIDAILEQDRDLPADEEITEKLFRYHHWFVVRAGGRLLVAGSTESTEGAEAPQVEERLTELLGRILTASGPDESGFIHNVYNVDGVVTALPRTGLPSFELMADFRPIWNWLNNADEESASRIIGGLGIDAIQVAGLRVSLDESVVHSGLFISAPAPRRGILSLLDQQALDPEPAEWVPADVVDYGHTSLDLGEAYTQIKSLLIENLGEEADAGFARAEMPVKAFSGADLSSVLSSLGNRHTALTFEPKLRTFRGPLGDEMEMPSQRLALVWQPTDLEIWDRIFQAAKGFAQLAQGAIEFGEEQGFSGWRMKSDAMEGGLFLGKGFLVLALGEGILERTLSAINNPPTGADALQGSENLAKAAEILNLKPGIGFQIQDGNRYMQANLRSLGTMMGQLEQLSPDGEDDPFLTILPKLLELVPDEDEIENMFGVGASVSFVNDHGLVITSAAELPAP